MTPPHPDPRIFRQYDIRGVVGVDLDAGVARSVGRAYGAELRGRIDGSAAKVVVGRDNRPSSPELAAALVDGLRSAGCAVTDLGTVPTPVAYFSEREFAADGSIQITGSHNPPEYNGIKMTMGARSVHGPAVQALLRRIREADYRPAASEGARVAAAAGPPGDMAASAAKPQQDVAPGARPPGDAAPGECQPPGTWPGSGAGGAYAQVDPLPAYVADLAARFRVPSKGPGGAPGSGAGLHLGPKIVVDCGNGAAAVVAVELLEAVGAEVVPLYCESDGTFPNHHPDPTVAENVRDLADKVLEHRASAGIGFDGDADRIGVVDDRGEMVRGDMLLLLFGLELLRLRGPGGRLVFDIKCSQILADEFAKAGGVPVMWKTGHSLIKEKMRETGALLAGELSGHICFADEYLGFDDALYAACRLVRMLRSSDRPLSAMTAALPVSASTPELRIEVPEDEKFEIVERARERFSATHEVVALDGVRVVFDDGWGLIRASNTQPVIVARYEAGTKAQLADIRGVMEDWLRNQGVEV